MFPQIYLQYPKDFLKTSTATTKHLEVRQSVSKLFGILIDIVEYKSGQYPIRVIPKVYTFYPALIYDGKNKSKTYHYVGSVRTSSFSDPYFPAFGKLSYFLLSVKILVGILKSLGKNQHFSSTDIYMSLLVASTVKARIVLKSNTKNNIDKYRSFLYYTYSRSK